MKALVISGGGSKGAFAGGVAQYLIEQQKRDYDMFVGTSTGSLLMPHLANGDIDRVKEVYTSVTQKDIFSVDPFVIKQRDNADYAVINYVNLLKQFITGKRTFGESLALRDTIRLYFTKKDFDAVKAKGKEVIITVSNLTTNKAEYKLLHECIYDDFCDWMWLSCNFVPFMSLVQKNGCEYGDGGFASIIPIREAIQKGATEVDAIVLQPELKTYNNTYGKNPFLLMLGLTGFLLDRVEYYDILIGQLKAQSQNVKLNLYFTPSELTSNSLIFNKEKMLQWWSLGFEYAERRIQSNGDYSL